jgi:hypothetical protein
LFHIATGLPQGNFCFSSSEAHVSQLLDFSHGTMQHNAAQCSTASGTRAGKEILDFPLLRLLQEIFATSFAGSSKLCPSNIRTTSNPAVSNTVLES